MMKLTVRKEQMDVMAAVAEVNFERKIAEHLRASYADSIVKLPDGGEFPIRDLLENTLSELIRVGISKARRYEVTNQSSTAAFVALMFDVAPNFDEHRVCGVLLGDEDKAPNDRVDELLTVLTEKHWDSIRKDYDSNAWIEKVEDVNQSETEQPAPAAEKANAATADPMSRTISGKTMSRTIRKGQTIKIQPAPSSSATFDENTIRIDRKE
jgi:hypothetical protein